MRNDGHVDLAEAAEAAQAQARLDQVSKLKQLRRAVLESQTVQLAQARPLPLPTRAYSYAAVPPPHHRSPAWHRRRRATGAASACTAPQRRAPGSRRW